MKVGRGNITKIAQAEMKRDNNFENGCTSPNTHKNAKSKKCVVHLEKHLKITALANQYNYG